MLRSELWEQHNSADSLSQVLESRNQVSQDCVCFGGCEDESPSSLFHLLAHSVPYGCKTEVAISWLLAKGGTSF